MKLKRIACLVIVMISLLSITVNAGDFFGKIISDGGTFMDSSKNESASVSQSNLSPVIKGLAQAGIAVGTVVAVIAGIIIGIKFMSEGAMGKAEMKQALTPYLIGVCLLFACYAIWSIIMGVFNSMGI